jgi:hypothetical protein
MDDLIKLRVFLEKNKEILEAFEGLVTASVLLGYVVSVKQMGHKKYVYFATNFINKKKEVRLDFSFEKNGNLVSLCTCRGDCKSVDFSDKCDGFKNTIECFKNILFS